MNTMKNTIDARADTLIGAVISQIQANVLATVFVDYPLGSTFDCVVTGLHELISSRSVLVRPAYRDNSVERLQWHLQALLYTRMHSHLQTLVGMALDHVADIESGIEDGTYKGVDNPDVANKRTIMEAFDQCVPYSGGRVFQAEPSRVLCVMTPGNGLASFHEQGTEPGVVVRTIDCMTRAASDRVVFSLEWASLLAQAFGNDLPPYVLIGPPTDSGHTALHQIAKELGEVSFLQALCRSNPGGVRRLLTEAHFTYELDGEDVIFTDELRQQVEHAIGDALEERVYAPNHTCEVALAVPDAQLPQIQDFLRTISCEEPATETTI